MKNKMLATTTALPKSGCNSSRPQNRDCSAATMMKPLTIRVGNRGTRPVSR